MYIYEAALDPFALSFSHISPSTQEAFQIFLVPNYLIKFLFDNFLCSQANGTSA